MLASCDKFLFLFQISKTVQNNVKTKVFVMTVLFFRLVPVQDSSQCGVSSSVSGLKLQLGRQTLQCSAYVKGEITFHFYTNVLLSFFCNLAKQN